MFTENVSVYRFSGLGAFAGAALLAGAAAGLAGPVPAAAGAAGMLPNANDRLIPKLTEKKLGPIP